MNRDISAEITANLVATSECKTCGCSRELEGDFVAYKSSGGGTTEFKGAYKVTTSWAKDYDITPFTFRACLQCSQDAWLKKLHSCKIAKMILFSFFVLGITGLVVYDKFLDPASPKPWYLGLVAPVSFGMMFISIFGYLAARDYFNSFHVSPDGFPSNATKISPVLLLLNESKIMAYVAKTNPQLYVYRCTNWTRYGDFCVVTREEWEKKKVTPES
jgi:hypothetical protein